MACQRVFKVSYKMAWLPKSQMSNSPNWSWVLGHEAHAGRSRMGWDLLPLTGVQAEGFSMLNPPSMAAGMNLRACDDAQMTEASHHLTFWIAISTCILKLAVLRFPMVKSLVTKLSNKQVCSQSNWWEWNTSAPEQYGTFCEFIQPGQGFYQWKLWKLLTFRHT